jgi:hypothetical protein
MPIEKFDFIKVVVWGFRWDIWSKCCHCGYLALLIRLCFGDCGYGYSCVCVGWILILEELYCHFYGIENIVLVVFRSLRIVMWFFFFTSIIIPLAIERIVV